MAEALLRRIDSEHFVAVSAAIGAATFNPLIVEVMQEIGIDLGSTIPARLADVLGRKFDFVITLGADSKVTIPKFLGAELAHWRIEDPAEAPDIDRQRRALRIIRDQIAQRLKLFDLVQIRPGRLGTTANSDQIASAP
jgi:ArsR family transcriptional regulator